MHDERVRRHRDRTIVEDDFSAGDVLDVSEANDVFDGAEQIKLPCADGSCLGHHGNDFLVHAEHDAGCLEATDNHVAARLTRASSRGGMSRQGGTRSRRET